MSGAALRPNPVRETLLSGGISIGPMVFEFFTPGLFAICKQAGADFVLLDMEHSGVGMDTIRLQLAAARGTGVAPLVRVPGNAYHLDRARARCWRLRHHGSAHRGTGAGRGVR